jgi:rhodanese-related sulfurtransferase
MPNFYNAPEVSIHEVDRKLRANEKFVLLDVREPAELEKAKLQHPNMVLTPLSELTEKRLDALPQVSMKGGKMSTAWRADWQPGPAR